MNKSCSTKNISIENTRNTSTVRKTINDVRVEQLLNKHKNLEESDKKMNIEDNQKKIADVATGTDKEKNAKTNPIFYDFIPILLQHLKQKESYDEMNKENDYIYNKINSIYNKNLLHRENFTTKKKKNGELLLENPIIRYLFLEKTLYNLRHKVKFIDIKNQGQIEENVLKIINEEYQNLKQNNFLNDINDFTTYGYEFDPKLFIKFQQDMQKIDIQKYFNEIKTMNKSVQKNSSTKLSMFSNKGGFFTTNKSEYKNIDKTMKSGGFLSRILNQQGFPNKMRKFKGLKIKEKEIFSESDSNKAQNISQLILKDTEINLSSEKNKDENNINEEILSIPTIKKKIEKTERNANIIPHPLFQNDRLRLTQPPIQNGVLSSLTKKLINKEKRPIIKKEKEITKKIEININKKAHDFSKVTPVINSNHPKEVTKIRI